MGATNASITSWTRLEPSCRDNDLGSTTGARVFDPLWMLTRQWQLGEFQGEDSGTPVRARVRATTAPVSRVHLGELPEGPSAPGAPYNPERMPLEAMVERRRWRANAVNEARALPLAVDGGLHFLRMLAAQPLSGDYRSAFIARFAFDQTLPQGAAADSATERFVQTHRGRCVDARRLAAALRSKGPAKVAADPPLKVATGDRAEVRDTLKRWLAWYDTVATEPATPADDAWLPARLEYGVAVSARLSAQAGDEHTFTAGEFDDGRLDWSRFDLAPGVTLGGEADAAFRSLTETRCPRP